MKGVSVIIPVYNREPLLEEAIRSVLAQEYGGPLEIIVSDDGSTDKSLQIAESFGRPVRIVHKPFGCKAQGVSATRNRGIAAATQPYIAFLDSDDFYLPNHLNRLAKVLETRPEVAFVFARLLQMKEDGGNRLFAPWTRNRLTRKHIAYPVISGPAIIHTNVIMCRKYVFEVVGGFNESLTNMEDGDMWMRISERYKGDFSDHFGAVYRIAHTFGQLTDRENENRIEKSLEAIMTDALERCLRQQKIDRYRLFRIHLSLASFKKQYSLALIRLSMSFPFYTISTFLDRERLTNRKRKLAFTDINKFVRM
jgi:glycosyltransferase involved in cell wall biosynthesis